MKAEYADADRARPARRHGHVIRPPVRAHDRPVVAYPAAHVERPHAVGAHVAERHGLDRFVEASGGHLASVGRAAVVGEGGWPVNLPRPVASPATRFTLRIGEPPAILPRHDSAGRADVLTI
jgi:hypothetical protein